VDRGLFEVQTKRSLVIFSTTRYVLTPAGEAAQAELDHWLAAGQTHFAGWVGDDPVQALAYAAAGAALLLMPPLFANLRQLREQTRLSSIDDDDGAGVSSVMYTPISSSDSDTSDPFNFGNFDFGSMATDVLSTFDSAMSAIDSAIDSATSSSDSGSGDSGGGGSDSGGGGGDSGRTSGTVTTHRFA
jgi:hypothetical protein